MKIDHFMQRITDMVQRKLESFGKSVVQIADAIVHLDERLKEVEARQPLRGQPGEPGLKGDPGQPGKNGDPGKDADPISADQISRAVSEHLAAHPPAPGMKGDPGKDAPAISDEVIAQSVARYLRENPPPRGEPGLKGDPGNDGNPGENAEPISDEQVARAVEQYLKLNPPAPGAKGDPGLKGDPGTDAEPIVLQDVVDELLRADKLLSLVELRAKEAVAAIPPPKDGVPGKDGLPGPKGDLGTPGEKGDPGADGIGLAGAMIDRDGTLIITTTKGDAVRLGPVVGKDGADGLGFDDMDANYNGERGVTLKFMRGEKSKEFNFHLPVIMDRGYWREGFKAKQGDAVTHDGTLWIALRDTESKPCLENKDDWRIGARKGRDGRNGSNGKDAPGTVKLESASA